MDSKEYDEASKERLNKIADKKIETTMIGALSAIEDIFGYLWNHQSRDKSDNEQAFAEMYQKVRSKILDIGNSQKRALKTELQTYTIHWDRYTMVMPVKARPNVQ